MTLTWDDVVAMATALPEVAEATTWGTPSLKVAGKLMARLRTEDDGGLAVKCSAADKEALVAGPDPAYYTLPHYDRSNYVLVDLDRVDHGELAELIADAWHIAAPARLRKQRP
ncbi:MmcQ/YjbR family DNA-binding protein [Aeromicrobium wangtongii]|uniref:MmcQ/YjbR family DNA-binding protein n=1 Tax=Aeromicrobium wangtongii TaxID=2969247 RepID=UPI00201759C0|nr:MmcQ/YjbR family DNA-binding protein [Aeromicrobium wangtongii]MCL3819729.1 MmcQ/YjbR family DNA-binding protein [Aeromicrobium wangtongii]